MRIVAPKPFTFSGGNRAVLLLHGFTGTTADVRQLGRYLQQCGYTCHGPLYAGHGGDPLRLIQTGPDDWWEDVLEGYRLLQSEGYKDVAVAGVSLGGLFSLKVGEELHVKGIVAMSAPMKEKSIDELSMRVTNYARAFKQLEGKTEAQIDSEIKDLEVMPMASLSGLRDLIVNTRAQVSRITSPIFVVQGMLDDPPYRESAQFIYDTVASDDKQIKWYEESGHIITLDKERQQVYEDIRVFLDLLEW